MSNPDYAKAMESIFAVTPFAKVHFQFLVKQRSSTNREDWWPVLQQPGQHDVSASFLKSTFDPFFIDVTVGDLLQVQNKIRAVMRRQRFSTGIKCRSPHHFRTNRCFTIISSRALLQVNCINIWFIKHLLYLQQSMFALWMELLLTCVDKPRQKSNYTQAKVW